MLSNIILHDTYVVYFIRLRFCVNRSVPICWNTRAVAPHAPRACVVIVCSYQYEHIQCVTRVFSQLFLYYDSRVRRWTRSPIQSPSARATSTAVSFLFSVVTTRTRSRAGGARSAKRGGATVPCVRTVVLQRRSGPVSCRAAFNPAYREV